VGPTASGKTSLAIALAERLGAEIISADSMQVYRGMEIGTAAPTPEEQARVRHHFVSCLEPDAVFSAGAFERMARPLVESWNAEGRVAVVAGGSGLYVRALVDGLFPGPARDEAIREDLHAEASERGVPALYARLRDADPGYAEVINPGDLRRIVRGLEVYRIMGRPLSELHEEHQAEREPLEALQVALHWPRETLYARMDARCERMLEAGFVDEVARLREAGYEKQLRRIRTLGYREFLDYLDGALSSEEALDRMKRNTRRFAKRQLTWFRSDPRIHWLPVDGATPLERHVDRILERVEAP
jgi:tRNA dimethylallyltransferase